jgi:hypothetical protein
MSADPLTSEAAVSEISLMAWVDVAEPGARLVYHRGFLVVDTASDVSTLGKSALEDLQATANAAYRLSELGRVHLVQQRLEIDRFAYIAIARPKPKSGTGSMSALRIAEQAA